MPSLSTLSRPSLDDVLRNVIFAIGLSILAFPERALFPHMTALSHEHGFSFSSTGIGIRDSEKLDLKANGAIEYQPDLVSIHLDLQLVFMSCDGSDYEHFHAAAAADPSFNSTAAPSFASAAAPSFNAAATPSNLTTAPSFGAAPSNSTAPSVVVAPSFNTAALSFDEEAPSDAEAAPSDFEGPPFIAVAAAKLNCTAVKTDNHQLKVEVDRWTFLQWSLIFLIILW